MYKKHSIRPYAPDRIGPYASVVVNWRDFSWANPTNLGVRLKIVTCFDVDMNQSMWFVGISRSAVFIDDAFYSNKSRGLQNCRVRPVSTRFGRQITESASKTHTELVV